MRWSPAEPAATSCRGAWKHLRSLPTVRITASDTLPIDQRVSNGHRPLRQRWPSGEFRVKRIFATQALKKSFPATALMVLAAAVPVSTSFLAEAVVDRAWLISIEPVSGRLPAGCGRALVPFWPTAALPSGVTADFEGDPGTHGRCACWWYECHSPKDCPACPRPALRTSFPANINQASGDAPPTPSAAAAPAAPTSPVGSPGRPGSPGRGPAPAAPAQAARVRQNGSIASACVSALTKPGRPSGLNHACRLRAIAASLTKGRHHRA